MKLILMLFVVIVLVLTGCMTTNYESVKSEIVNRVDPLSIKDDMQFWMDVAFCTERSAEEADRTNREIVGRAFAGALMGAAVGAAYGSAWGNRYIGTGARIGATSGAVAGMNSVQTRYYYVMTNCLLNRGYLLLW